MTKNDKRFLKKKAAMLKSMTTQNHTAINDDAFVDIFDDLFIDGLKTGLSVYKDALYSVEYDFEYMVVHIRKIGKLSDLKCTIKPKIIVDF